MNSCNSCRNKIKLSKLKHVNKTPKGGPGEYSLQNQETPLIKNLQFLTNFDETLPKCSPHESIILTKFRQNWTKIEDFLLIAQLVQNHLFILDCLQLVKLQSFKPTSFSRQQNLLILLSRLPTFSDEAFTTCSCLYVKFLSTSFQLHSVCCREDFPNKLF